MANFNAEFKKILKNLEENISDKQALDIAKVEIFNLYNLFFDEITNLEQVVNDKITTIAQSQLNIEEKVNELGKSVKNIEKDIYMDEEFEDEDYDIEIKCPYCNETFTAEMNDITAAEIICPECNNTIELDWGHECDCGCGDEECDCNEDDCDCCSHDCHHNEDVEDDM